MKKIFLFLMIFVILMSSFLNSYAGDEVLSEVLDEQKVLELWKAVDREGYRVFDIGALVDSPPSTVFACDSNGVPYANGQEYAYGNFGKKINPDECLELTKKAFLKCMTEELADRLLSNYKIPGGPDLEFFRTDDEGNVYRLYHMIFGSIRDIYSIQVNGTTATAACNINMGRTNPDLRTYNGYMGLKGIYIDSTIDFVYTSDGWRMSGGEIFDFIRNYAAKSPGTGETGEPLSPTELSEDVFKSLMQKVSYSTGLLYNLNTLQTVYPTVLFGYDSNGVAYAGGKCYYYIDYGNKNLGGYRAMTFDGLRDCMTRKLAEKMTEDFHVPGGTDVELIRRGSDGRWYKLFLIQPRFFVFSIDGISVNGNEAQVKCNVSVGVIDLERMDTRPYPYDKEIRMDATIDLVYTEDGWRISGGDVFDYILNYAATSPETGDSDGTRAATLAATAAVAAVLPAVILTVSRRRRRSV